MEHRTRAADERLAAESEKRGQGVGAISAYLRRAIETGGFTLAGPWAGFLGIVALVVAWRVLPDATEADLGEPLPTPAEA